MLHRNATDHLHFAVIGKTSAQIWGDDSGVHTKPITVHDPRSRPHLGIASGPKATSNYDTREIAHDSLVKFNVIPGWLRPSLDENYCELIYKRPKVNSTQLDREHAAQRHQLCFEWTFSSLHRASKLESYLRVFLTYSLAGIYGKFAWLTFA
jgi:hypothetical protein